jgi:C-terminal processing protease CtpA/Prc
VSTGSAFDEVCDFEVTDVEFANGERHTTQAAGRNDDLWTRKGDVTDQYWTDPYVPGKRLEGKPAFVLTSKNTFSGGEEFTNNLKVLKRATIVGETTGGGAHPVRGHRITEHFGIGVPFARAINPVTHTNWEGTGVEADVKVDASQALEEAIKLATERIKNNAK